MAQSEDLVFGFYLQFKLASSIKLQAFFVACYTCQLTLSEMKISGKVMNKLGQHFFAFTTPYNDLWCNKVFQSAGCYEL